MVSVGRLMVVVCMAWSGEALGDVPAMADDAAPKSPGVVAADTTPSEPRIYHVPSPGFGTRGETEPPRYVRTLSEVGIAQLADLYWLDFGVDYRFRFEYRDDDYRRSELTLDRVFLQRSRVYLGVHDVLDPLRGAIEFSDARHWNSRFPDDNRDVNENEIIQAIGELYFRDALGADRPLRFQVGRFAFDYLDRRLISRNPWRNTANNFDGFRLILGQQDNDWQIDVLAMQPVERRIRQPDRANEEEWFYGLIGQWRRWSESVTLQPYYLMRDVDRKDPSASDREIHTFGLRGYGYIGRTGLDYDFNAAWQAGRDGDRIHRALGLSAEVGYRFEHSWKPRLSAYFGYADGDRDPSGTVMRRFDRHYGFGRAWSDIEFFIWENLITPKVRLELQPHRNVWFDVGYHWFWLASDNDSWGNIGRGDPLGQSGTYVGQELDIKLRWRINPRVELLIGYAFFEPGPFARKTGQADDSDFFYVETSIQLWE